MKPARQPIDGVLLLNKPVGITSNAALQKAKWLLNAKKAGHTGTLDPFADGLLPLCFGEATKFSAYLLDADKHYRATMRLGITTTTGDPEGEILAERPVASGCDDIQAVLPRFRGETEQIPPMHSALKHQGRPLYEYARAGIEIERPPRKVRINALDLVECAPPVVVFDVQCSAGTYIRTLAQDIGAALGCGAHLTGLARTAVGGFQLAQAHSLTALEALPAAERTSLLLPLDAMLTHLPVVDLSADETTALIQGRSVPFALQQQGLVRLYAPGNDFIGLAEAGAGQLVPRRLCNTADRAAHARAGA
ncbi:tRNA pseudouridine(55) synthase TruB [Thiobacillus sp.]|uniref:tRNA pseudouridine(55) synthase TruB n=1 Tax=Thiobacillus sp. TaxID=924 RepID=UPI00286D7050|nr:tRNA pseudouridine(55) synthase TruB [Thiobacillus sp.]